MDHLLLKEELGVDIQGDSGVGTLASTCCRHTRIPRLREESRQTNIILQYTLHAAILSAVCSVIQ